MPNRHKNIHIHYFGLRNCAPLASGCPPWSPAQDTDIHSAGEPQSRRLSNIIRVKYMLVGHRMFCWNSPDFYASILPLPSVSFVNYLPSHRILVGSLVFCSMKVCNTQQCLEKARDNRLGSSRCHVLFRLEMDRNRLSVALANSGIRMSCHSSGLCWPKILDSTWHRMTE